MPDSIRWARSWDDAVRATRASGKLLLVDFYADWCGWCKRLDQDVYPDPQVVRLVNQMVAVKLDTERAGKPQATRFQASSLPTILILDSKLTVVGRINGYLPADAFRERVESIVAGARDLPALVARLKANPRDGRMAVRLAQKAVEAGQASTAAWAADMADRAQPGAIDYQTHFTIGQLLGRVERIDDARKHFTRALALAKTGSRKATVHFFIGVTHFQQKRPTQARQELERALSFPDCPDQIRSLAQRGLADINGKR